MAEAAIKPIDAGIQLLVIYTEHVAVVDTMRMVEYARLHGRHIVGPNAAGASSPVKGNVSDIEEEWLSPGRIGIVSRSGTLTYEVLDGLLKNGEGVGTVACLGGDPISVCDQLR